jgi:hypothetical protein
MAFPTTELFGLGYGSGQRIFFFRWSYFSAVKVYTRELPGSVAGVYKCLLTPGRWRFGVFWGVLWLKIR